VVVEGPEWWGVPRDARDENWKGNGNSNRNSRSFPFALLRVRMTTRKAKATATVTAGRRLAGSTSVTVGFAIRAN
jgi:hypothetical protein